MLEELLRISEYREFLRQFTAQQLKIRYRGSVLGFLWTLLNPILICLSLSIVFSYINKWDLRTAGVYFFGGYVPWTFFVSSTSSAAVSIIGNSHYVTRIYVPRSIFPISTVLVNLVDLATGVLVIFGYMAITGVPFRPALLILPVSVVVVGVFVLGLCLLFAALNVFLRDFQHLWATLSFLWFFFTPILYPLSAIPASVRPYFEANPILPFIRLFQQPISDGVVPSVAVIGTALLYSLVTLTLGISAFYRSERAFYLYL